MKKVKKQNQQKTKAPAIRERVASTLDVSKEVILDYARLEFIGNREVTVENYKSIVEYTGTLIVLDTNPQRLKIHGTGLEIKSIAREMLFITGNVLSAEFGQEV